GAERDADARRQEDLLLIELERPAHLGEDRPREMRDGPAIVGIGRQALDEQRELVAREPADRRALRQRARQALGEHLPRAIACWSRCWNCMRFGTRVSAS